MFRTLSFLSIVCLLISSLNSVSAHPGGLDDNGGHLNRSTGQYHCHRDTCVTSENSNVLTPETIRIASFNIRTFGRTKIKKADVMAKLALIVKRFDIVAIQEIKDVSGSTAPKFLEVINADGSKYDFIISERTGRQANDKTSQEQYAYFFNTKTIVTNGYDTLFDDSQNDLFQREPYIAAFKVVGGSFTFVLINIHTKPTIAVQEIESLYEAYKWSVEKYQNEDDFIMLGDFNASCSYASDSEISNLSISTEKFKWIIPNNADTNQSDNSECAYDRIVISDGAKTDYADEWGVLKVGDKRVSDHHVIWASFHSSKD